MKQIIFTTASNGKHQNIMLFLVQLSSNTVMPVLVKHTDTHNENSIEIKVSNCVSANRYCMCCYI